MRADGAIYDDVVAVLHELLGQADHRVGVTVAKGVVTLTGYVSTVETKVEAELAIARVPGVRAVAEGLHVLGEPVRPLSDTSLAHAIVDCLPVPVTVRVEDGWVTLGGDVDTSQDYDAVERALECVPGVRGVTSEVRIERASMPV